MAEAVKKITIAILGPGSVGSFLAAAFLKAGFSLTCIAKPERAKEITEQGICVESPLWGTYTAHPRAVGLLERAPNILFITTKATGLKEALERINPEIMRGAIIIPLLNGIEHRELLRARFPGQVAAGTISIEVYQSDSGRVIHATSFAKIRIAADDADLHARMADIARVISEAHIAAEIGANETQILWEKLVRLNALALTTSYYKKPIGEIRADEEMRNELLLLINEAVAVAQKEGAVIGAEDVLLQIDRLEPGQFSSLKRDIDQRKTSELDAIAGSIVRAGRRHSLSCPTIERFINALL